ncbi:MAG: hypothetical protein ACOC6J_10115 [Spirochaetota bacterium]
MTKDVRKGEVITADAFEPDTDAFVYKLRELQEGLVAKGALS